MQKVSVAYVKELWNCNREKAFSRSGGYTSSNLDRIIKIIITNILMKYICVGGAPYMGE